jgi:Na+/melibiose symporter-like transporter
MHPEVQARLGFQAASREQAMSLGTILLIVLVLILVGVIPTWPHSRSWGYRPTGMVGAILIVLLILLLTGRI